MFVGLFDWWFCFVDWFGGYGLLWFWFLILVFNLDMLVTCCVWVVWFVRLVFIVYLAFACVLLIVFDDLL